MGGGGLGSGRSKVHISDQWVMKHYIIWGWLSSQVKYVIVLHGPLKAFLFSSVASPRRFYRHLGFGIWTKFHRKLKRRIKLLKCEAQTRERSTPILWHKVQVENCKFIPWVIHPSQCHMDNQEGTQKICRNMNLERVTDSAQSWGSQNLHRNAPRIWKKKLGLGWSNKLLPSWGFFCLSNGAKLRFTKFAQKSAYNLEWRKKWALGGATNCCPVEVLSVSVMEQMTWNLLKFLDLEVKCRPSSPLCFLHPVVWISICWRGAGASPALGSLCYWLDPSSKPSQAKIVN